MPNSGQALALVRGTIPWNHFSSQWIHRIFLFGPSPHLSTTCLLKATCFIWFSAVSPGLMFLAYKLYVSCDFSHVKMQVCWHQLLMCFANALYVTQLYALIASTNSASMNGCLASCCVAILSNSERTSFTTTSELPSISPS